ncbi:MAG: gfo/Idh/MocA family oxidoreductase [Pirellulaceae bacterium]|nr:gfo/Idh/MocA family oxidoreductase [Pirellulaceae bacterium]
MHAFFSHRKLWLALSMAALVMPLNSLTAQDAKTKVARLGIIGLDTSHVKAFTGLFNDPKQSSGLGDMRVVVAFPGGSPDIESSHSRVAGFVEDVKKLDVKIVDSVKDVVAQSDAVLLESVDGRPHLEQALPVLRSGKPLFIDKPLAGSLADAIAIDMLAKKYNARWFSSSSLRFSPSIYRWRTDDALRTSIRGASAWSPCSLEKSHPDLFWYGVHGVEVLYTVMGEGCQTVTRAGTPGTDLVVGVWDGGRIGTFRGIRDGKSDYGVVVYGEKSIELTGKYEGYKPLVEQIAKFFAGGAAPVSNQETLEMFAFMEAAQQSKDQGGIPIKIADVMAQATEKAKQRVATLDK